MTGRLWREGEPITVTATDQGKPLSFVWLGERHLVERICDRWRASEEWWRTDDEAWRDYIKLATRSGLLCLVAHDGGTQNWWLIRLYN
ncbi:MAG: hypothetical protein KIT87_29945 [Anaerolineae bacterium]|nr:hypothetical protein [Anaerolineae bacterium]